MQRGWHDRRQGSNGGNYNTKIKFYVKEDDEDKCDDCNGWCNNKHGGEAIDNATIDYLKRGGSQKGVTSNW